MHWEILEWGVPILILCVLIAITYRICAGLESTDFEWLYFWR